jgi:hypothetical protein
MAVGFIWACCQCHSLDSEIVTDFQVDLVFAAVCVLGDEHSLGLEFSLGGEHSLFLCLLFLVVDDRRAVAGKMIYMPMTCFPAMVEEAGKVMERFPF